MDTVDTVSRAEYNDLAERHRKALTVTVTVTVTITVTVTVTLTLTLGHARH